MICRPAYNKSIGFGHAGLQGLALSIALWRVGWVTAKLRSLIRLALDGDGSMLDPGDSWICSCVI